MQNINLEVRETINSTKTNGDANFKPRRQRDYQLDKNKGDVNLNLEIRDTIISTVTNGDAKFKPRS